MADTLNDFFCVSWKITNFKIESLAEIILCLFHCSGFKVKVSISQQQCQHSLFQIKTISIAV